MIVFPAESTRIASIRSSRVSTFSSGSAIVRNDGIVTAQYVAMAKMYAAVLNAQSTTELDTS
jgi:hypothetical protein